MTRGKLVVLLTGLFLIGIVLMMSAPGAPSFYNHRRFEHALIDGRLEPCAVTIYNFPLIPKSQGDGSNSWSEHYTGDVRVLGSVSKLTARLESRRG